MNKLNNEQTLLFKTLDEEFAGIRHGQLPLQYKRLSILGAEYISKKNDNRVQRVDLTSCELTDRGCSFIVTAQWKNLTSINLANNRLTNRSCKLVSQAKWPGLLELALGSNDIEDAGLLHLTKGNFKALRAISIYDSKFVKGIRILSKSDWALISLYLYNNEINELELINAVLCQWYYLHTLWAKPQTLSYWQLQHLNGLLKQRFHWLKSVNLR